MGLFLLQSAFSRTALFLYLDSRGMTACSALGQAHHILQYGTALVRRFRWSFKRSMVTPFAVLVGLSQVYVVVAGT